MTIYNYLKQYSQQAEPLLDEIFAELNNKAVKIDPFVTEALNKLREFLRGGKKHRGALCVLAYEIFGGKLNSEIIKASLSLEITHAALLIHDDFMDQDSLRRGQPTLHKQFEKEYTPHFGASQAVTLGDTGFYLALELLAETHFAPQDKLRAIKVLAENIRRTTYGQMLDLLYAEQKNITLRDILRVHHLKTAVYSMVLPLQIGAILAQAKASQLTTLKQFGQAAGLAFQIHDDEIGLFGQEKLIGKPAGSDVRENKNTILKIKALENASSADKQFLLSAYNNKNLTVRDLQGVRKITQKTGAYDFSRQLGQKYIQEAKKYVPQITQDSNYQKILYNLADFIIEREK